MTTSEALALYRAERSAAVKRGADIRTAKPVPGSKGYRLRAINMSNGHAISRDDAFVITRSDTR